MNPRPEAPSGGSGPAAPLPASREPVASTRYHLEALTGLRIFAALAVYISHLWPPKNAPTWLVTAMESGYAGVTVFFVLSGFVLAINYWDRLHTPADIWRYTVARFARIYPVYLLVLSWPAAHLAAHHDLPWRRLLEHALALQAWDPDVKVTDAFVGPAWSISVEFFLYACLPVVLPLLRLVDRRLWRTIGLMCAIVVVMVLLALWFRDTGRATLPWTDPASAHRWLYRTPLTRLGDFVLGVLAARLYLRRRQVSVAVGWLLIGAPLVAFAVLATRRSLLFSAFSWDVAYAVPAVVLITGLAVAPSNPFARALSTKPVVLLGEASYAFYLVHTFVIESLDPAGRSVDLTTAEVVIQVQDLGVALIFAVGLHLAVERPARVWLRNRLTDNGAVAREPQR